MAYHRRHDDPLTMVLFRAPDPRACGIVELAAQGRIVSFVEKPEQPKSDLANAGLYVLDAAAYRAIAAMGAFDFGFDVLPRFVGRMRGWVWGGYFRDVGTHAALERAREDAATVFPAAARTGRGADTGPGAGAGRPAVFLDRDGTLIEHVPYLSDPALVRVLPGAAEALVRFRRAGFACVLVTNQSAIGRGMLTLERLEEIHAELDRHLAVRGATLDAIYYCPVAPESDERTLVECPDRKPGPGMLLRAAAERQLDLSASWMVGDLISDVLAGLNAGCRSILVHSGQTTAPQPGSAVDPAPSVAGRALVAADLAAAAELILSSVVRGP
jgi:D-glycero-D-manno-heptose 1,7-bisphosphate phosphatase